MKHHIAKVILIAGLLIAVVIVRTGPGKLSFANGLSLLNPIASAQEGGEGAEGAEGAGSGAGASGGDAAATGTTGDPGPAGCTAAGAAASGSGCPGAGDSSGSGDAGGGGPSDVSSCVASYGSPCTSAVNACNQTSSGTIDCNGVCTAQTPSCNGACNLSGPNGCSTGTLSNATQTNNTYQWSCVGSNGGSTASCSTTVSCPDNTPYTETNPSTIANYCATQGYTCGAGQQYVSSLSCNTGGAGTWRPYGRSCTEQNCTGCGCVPAPVIGVCAPTHYGCTVGTSSGGAQNGNTYTWMCLGANSGTTAFCSETVAGTTVTPTTVSLTPFSPATISTGQSSTISFSSGGGATSCSGSGIWNGDLGVTSATNQSTGPMNTPGTYTQTVTCTGPGGSATSPTRTLTVNDVSTAAPLPDLTAGPISPTTAIVGVATTFTSTASNIGNASTGSGFMSFFQEASSQNGAAPVTDAVDNVPTTAIAAGGTAPISTSYTFAAPGTYYVRACADKANSGSSGTIAESNENNNCGGSYTPIVVSIAGQPGCSATTINNCVLLGRPSGSSSGSCAAGFSGSCSYTCTSGTWSQNSNSCALSSATSAPTVSITASPNPVTSGDRSTLTWSASQDATRCTAGGPWSNSGKLSGNGLTDPLASDTTFTYQCTGAGGTSPVRSVTVRVRPSSARAVAAPTASLTATPPTINRGDSSTLTWDSTDTNSCTAAGGFSTGGATSGSAQVSPLDTSTYSITCEGPKGTTPPTNATIQVIEPALTITAVPPRIRSGTQSVISWNATGVKDCSITKNDTAWKSGTANGQHAYIGSDSDTVTSRTLYVLSCTDVTGAPWPTAASTTVNIVANFQEF